MYTPLPLWIELGIERKDETEEDEAEEWMDCDDETDDREEARERMGSRIPCSVFWLLEGLVGLAMTLWSGAGDMSGDGVSIMAADSSKRYWPTLMKISRGISLS
jgi:hypothetical protein